MQQPMPESTSATSVSSRVVPSRGRSTRWCHTRRPSLSVIRDGRSCSPSGPTRFTPQAWISPESSTTLAVTTPTRSSASSMASILSTHPGVSIDASASSWTITSPPAASSPALRASMAPPCSRSSSWKAGNRPESRQRRRISRLASSEPSSTATTSTRS